MTRGREFCHDGVTELPSPCHFPCHSHSISTLLLTVLILCAIFVIEQATTFIKRRQGKRPLLSWKGDHEYFKIYTEIYSVNGTM